MFNQHRAIRSLHLPFKDARINIPAPNMVSAY